MAKFLIAFDFVSLLSNFNLTPVPEAQAFAINVQNDVRGIGNPASRGPQSFAIRKNMAVMTSYKT